MSRTISHFWTQILLVMCVWTLAGCQVTSRTGQYQTWLSWRAVFQPALVYQRSRPQGPPGTCVASLRDACLINWNDRTFVDPRSLPTRAPPPAVTPTSGSAPANANAAKTAPSGSQSADAPAADDAEPEQLPPPAGIEGPELLPKPKVGPSAANVSAKGKSSRPGVSSPDDVEKTGREQEVGPLRKLWSRVFRRSEEPDDDEEESEDEEETESKAPSARKANPPNGSARTSRSVSSRRNQVGRQSVDSNAATFEVINPPVGEPADAKPAPAPTFWQRLFGPRPEVKPNANGNFQRPRPGETAANQPAQLGQPAQGGTNRNTPASPVSARRNAPFGTPARPIDGSGSVSPEPSRNQPGAAQSGATQPGPVRRFWNRMWGNPPAPEAKPVQANAPAATGEASIGAQPTEQTEPVAIPARSRPMTLRALLSRPAPDAEEAAPDAEPAEQTETFGVSARPRAMTLRSLFSRNAPAAETEDPDLDDPDRDLDDEEMDDPKLDRRR